MKKLILTTMILMLLLAGGASAQGSYETERVISVNYAVNMLANKDIRIYVTETLPDLLESANERHKISSSMPDLDTLEKNVIQKDLTIAVFNNQAAVIYAPGEELQFEYAVFAKNFLAKNGYDVTIKKVSELPEGKIIKMFFDPNVVCRQEVGFCETGAKFIGYNEIGCPIYDCDDSDPEGHIVTLKGIGDRQTIDLGNGFKLRFELVNINFYETHENSKTTGFADLELVSEYSNVATGQELRLYDGESKKTSSFYIDNVIVRPYDVKFTFHILDVDEPEPMCPEIICRPGTHPEVNGYDESGCKIVKCVDDNIACQAPACEGAYKTGKYYEDGCPIFECPSTPDYCSAPPSENCKKTGNFDKNGCPEYICSALPPDTPSLKRFAMGEGQSESFHVNNARVTMTLKEIGFEEISEEQVGYGVFEIKASVNGVESLKQQVKIYEDTNRNFDAFQISRLVVNEDGSNLKFIVALRGLIYVGDKPIATESGIIEGRENKKYDDFDVLLEQEVGLVSGESGVVKYQNNCDGCIVDGRCAQTGLRFKNDEASYCDISGEVLFQKQDGASCQNNYECESNTCASGECVDLVKQVRENTGLLQNILGWISGIF